jgi:hypothetical protein
MKIIVMLFLCLLISVPAIAKNDKAKGNHKELPPGLEKKIERGGELPPGWRKKLVKGDILDSRMYATAEDVSNIYLRTYPHSSAGSKFLRIEEKIIRIKNDTREILEVFGVNVGR